VNFTREPIIETIVSPREGCKLLVRSSKSGGPGDEYYVDAVEVVSFGRAFFFRSMERPKAFLVPVSDYEVLEVKETRVALKNVSHDRNIKIGGGREASLKYSHREPSPEKEEEALFAEERPAQAEESTETAMGDRMEKRRDRRRRRHRRPEEEWAARKASESQQVQMEGGTKAQEATAADEAKVAPPMFSSLIPPPSSLISETLSRYKEAPVKEIEEKEKKPKEEPPEEGQSAHSDSTPLHRTATISEPELLENSSLVSTYFSPLRMDKDFFF
jgi:hypothetical protein